MLIGVDVRPLMHGRVSGVENYIRSLLEAMLAVDRSHQYVFFYNSRQETGDFLKEFDRRRVKVVRTTYPNFWLHFRAQIGYGPSLDRLIESQLGKKIDLLFVPDPRIAPVSKSVKKVMTVHDLAFERYPQHFSQKSRLWFKLICPQREFITSDHLIAVSSFTKQELQEVYSIDDAKISVISEAVPGRLKPVTDSHERQRIREKYGLPERYFLTFSTIEPRKNLEMAIKAFSLFQKRYPLETYRLVLAGQHDERLFGKVFLSDHPDVFRPGFIDEEDKAAVYSMARGLLFLSTYEGFGLPILEAMACGTPVIGSRVASIPEVIGEAGLLVDPYDSEMVCEALHTLTLEDEFQTYRERGLMHAKQFSWKKAARQTLKLFERVAND